MDWIYQFLTDFAAWLNSIAHDFLSAFADARTFLVVQVAEFWNQQIAGAFKLLSLVRALPDPGLGALAAWIRSVLAPMTVVWTILDYTCYVYVVSNVLSFYLAIWALALPYRAWLILKRAVPFAG